jgi:phosphohistidine phosphatase SixA
MQFVVIRQAVENNVPLEECERGLTAHQDELSALAEWLRCHASIPSRYLTSATTEAQATANWLCRELAGDPRAIRTVDVLPPDGLLLSLKDLASYVEVTGPKKTNSEVVAIIGNEPRLQALVHRMTEVWYRPLEPAQALVLEQAAWRRHQVGRAKVKFRSPAPSASDKAVSPTATERYETISSSIRATDDISFKLLGLVPLLSGVGIFALLRGPKDRLSSAGVAFFAAFAALIAFALYRWELRNVQNCEWFRDRLADIERDEFGLLSGQYLLQPAPPTLSVPTLSVLGWPVRIRMKEIRIGKSQAERLLYRTTIAAWIILACYGLLSALGFDPLR